MADTSRPTVDIRRADERFKTRIGRLDSQHSFSFSSHGSRPTPHHGVLLVNNDDIVTPGGGSTRIPTGTWRLIASAPSAGAGRRVRLVPTSASRPVG